MTSFVDVKNFIWSNEGGSLNYVVKRCAAEYDDVEIIYLDSEKVALLSCPECMVEVKWMNRAHSGLIVTEADFSDWANVIGSRASSHMRRQSSVITIDDMEVNNYFGGDVEYVYTWHEPYYCHISIMQDSSDGGKWRWEFDMPELYDTYREYGFDTPQDALNDMINQFIAPYCTFERKVGMETKAELYPGVSGSTKIYDALAQYYPEELDFLGDNFPKDMTFSDYLGIRFDMPELETWEILDTSDSDTESKIAWLFAEAMGWDEGIAYDFVRYDKFPPMSYFGSCKAVGNDKKYVTAFDRYDRSIDWEKCIKLVSESISHDYDKGYDVFCEYMRKYFDNYPNTEENADIHREDAANAAYVLSYGEMDWYIDTIVRDSIFESAAWYLEEHGIAIPHTASAKRTTASAIRTKRAWSESMIVEDYETKVYGFDYTDVPTYFQAELISEEIYRDGIYRQRWMVWLDMPYYSDPSELIWESHHEEEIFKYEDEQGLPYYLQSFSPYREEYVFMLDEVMEDIADDFRREVPGWAEESFYDDMDAYHDRFGACNRAYDEYDRVRK